MTYLWGAAFVLSNIAWLYFAYRLLQDQRRERWDLQERIRNPEAPKPPPVLSPTEKEQAKIIERFVEKHDDEFDLVGKIDPDTPLRNDN